MKSSSRSWRRGLFLLWAGFCFGGVELVRAQQAPAAAPQQNPSAAQPSGGQTAPSAEAPPANPAAPPSEAPKLSKDDLEKLVAPIALYPDPLIATILPASAYPLEIVEAARFVQDTNNIAKLDEQKWDDNVKAVARIPDVISQMDKNIGWVGDLGDAFINQPKELMDAIQAMRTKAEDSGALKTTEQQTVKTADTIVTNTVQNETVYVTNQVTQIQPAQQDVVYVPQYNPTTVYGGAPVAYPGYVAPRPLVGTALTFGAGMAMGAWINNDCDWNHGGCWGGNYHSDVNINRNVNYNRNANVNRNGQKWQPDQNRLKYSGTSVNGQNRQARGYAAGTGQAANRSANAANAANRSANAANAANRASAVEAANRTASERAANRPSTGTAANRPETGTAANRASAAGQNAAATGAERNRSGAGTGASSVANNATRPSTANAGNRASAGTGGTGAAANRGEGNLSATGNRSGAAANAAQSKSSSGGSAFSGGSASAARSSSARGSASRSGSQGGGGGARGGGGGGGGASRGGGGGGGRR